MALKEIIKLTELDCELHKECTGDAKKLAHKIGVSRSTLFNLFDELKEIGAEIAYDSKEHTYYYKKEIKIVFAVGRESDKYLMIKDLKKIVGGLKIFTSIQDFGLLTY